MKLLCHVLLLLCVLVGGFSPNVSEASYCEQKTQVLFANGMFNSKGDVISSVKALEVKMKASGQIDEQWVFGHCLNTNEGARSIYEVFRQRMGDQVSSYWRWLGNMEIAPDWFQSSVQTVAASFDAAESLIDADLRDHVQRYQSLMMEGNRVLVVAHSQGNLYANAAYSNLSAMGLPMNSFGIVSVATPASRVAGGGPYFTLVNDIVIAAVESLFPGTLDPNVANIPNFNDWTNHSFVDSYLNGNQTGSMIVNSALSQANSLSWPTPQIGSGPISVTLTWGAERDVDLHVNEPDGSHVYYGNMWGSSGYLDYDDVTSWGPEHYYVVDCENLATGQYGVGVNYYSGNGPETAHVQVQAGDIIRDYSINLSAPEGSAGNSNAEPVASIEVIGDAENGYDFTVAGAGR